MEPVSQAAIVLIISLSLSLACWKLGMLTGGGAVATFFTGSAVGLLGSPEWFAILMIFTVTGLVATRIGFSKKAEKGVQEGADGERSSRNILGVGLPPCFVAAIFFLVGGRYQMELTIAFISTLAVAAADTIASEIGVRDERVWLITCFKRVIPGTNGGISAIGTAASLLASLIISALGWLIIFGTLDIWLLIPAAAGFFGNILDSLFGALFEDRGYFSKYTNNCVTAMLGAAFGAILYVLLV
ncbi:MAG: DUF92 domain-containing protein [Euryarchaeota archaeon]|nr:DUF92 domain-containing protein [Euryarchaeota archaeon]